MESYFEANAEFSKFGRSYLELKKNLPVRPSEMGVLNIVAQEPGPHTAVEAAELLGVSKPMIAAHVSSLEEKGYLVKRRAPDDGRKLHLLLTDKGRALVERAKREGDELFERLVQAMGRPAFDELVELVAEANLVLEAKRSGRE